jgi:Carbohydrate esterase, sialic acid-specific acetylesterase
MQKLLLSVVFGLSCVAAQAATIPTDLPRHDGQPASKKKPVKVYILSGQSNMVGFGALGGSRPAYPSIYLSADPRVMPCVMPVGASALLPQKIYQEATGDAQGAKALVYAGAYDPQADYASLKPLKEAVVALGNVTEMLPAVDGPHTVAVKAFIEVPISGLYEFHAGLGNDAHVMISLPGVKVYQKEPGVAPVIQKVPLLKGQRYPIAIMYPKGGTAIFWMEQVDIKGKGDLEWVVNELGLYKCLVDDKGGWTNRSDVIYTDAYLGNGSSSPLGPTSNGRNIGPEVGFGYVMGTFHDEPVLLIKSCTGNRSLSWDYLPPGSERYEMVEKDPTTGAEKTYIYAGYKDTQDRWEKGTQPQPGGWYAGKQYDESVAAVRKVLDNFGTKYPEFKDQGYEIAGFVWFQGHKDTGSDLTASRYEQNLVNLIKALRKEFKAPDAKFVVATGCGNPGREGRGLTIAEAQLAVDGDKGKYPEFKGNVKSVDSRGYWREVSESPGAKGYHYNLNAETYLLTGDALGRAMVQLLGGKADPTPGVCRPYSAPKPWPKNPTPEQGVEMIYSDAFMWSWVTDPAEPTPDQMAAMAPALRPIILDKMVPSYPEQSAKVPGYLHGGIYLEPIVTGKKPANIGAELASDLDTLFSYYKAAGIEQYTWKSFGPDMKNAKWDYFSFDPKEPHDPAKGGRYREITYPDGMANWFAADFDAAKAGWKTGEAPFGQNDSKLAALRPNCKSPQCGCATTPKTLWEKEVLLMRQTFEIPKLDSKHRYRLVVGGGAHLYAGEGFALYVDGKLLAEAKGGYYKSGGSARGGYVFNDFLPDFEDGKITIALKGFLRREGYIGKEAPPTGHLSVWLEQAEIPEVIQNAYKTNPNSEPKK